MSEYSEAYMQAKHQPAPKYADAMDSVFAQIQRGELLPPRGQQAVNVGLVAHALTDSKIDPPHYRYYHWVVDRFLAQTPIHELSAQLIGMAFVSANLLQTPLPQPLTLNPWQAPQMGAWPLASKQAVVIENNGVFIWLHHLHPEWPLINQGGNDFQAVYVRLLQQYVKRGLSLTYLGDLDATGIRIADTLRRQLPICRTFLDLQSPTNVSLWLSQFGKYDSKRTKSQNIEDEELRQEMVSISVQQRFVEQEQLIGEYERLIADWLR